MSVPQMPLDQLLVLLEKLANKSLGLWDMPKGSEARLINVSENATYLVQGPNDYKAILRIHRENYHSRSCLLYTSPSPRDGLLSRMPSSA